MSELMKETDDIAAKRKAFKEMKELLMKAVDIVNEVIYMYVCMYVCICEYKVMDLGRTHRITYVCTNVITKQHSCMYIHTLKHVAVFMCMYVCMYRCETSNRMEANED